MSCTRLHSVLDDVAKEFDCDDLMARSAHYNGSFSSSGGGCSSRSEGRRSRRRVHLACHGFGSLWLDKSDADIAGGDYGGSVGGVEGICRGESGREPA